MLAAANAVVVLKNVRRVIFMLANDPFSAGPSKYKSVVTPRGKVTKNCLGNWIPVWHSLAAHMFLCLECTKHPWPASVFLIGAVAFLTSGCDAGKTSASPGTRSREAALPSRAVEMAPVTDRRIDRYVVALGSFVAYEQATLSAKVPGRVQSIHMDLGSQVQVGGVLVQIEPRDYELKVQQAAAALAQARAGLGLSPGGENDQVDAEKVNTVQETRAVFEEAKTNLDRVITLSQDKILSQSAVDSAQSAYLVALNRYQDTREKVRQQQALVAQRRIEFEIAKQQLADTTIVAPFTGGIQRRQANLGEYLTVGSPVATLVQLDPLRLRVEVSERDAAKIRLGQTVGFVLEGDTNRHLAAIRRLSPALDERNRMLLVEADVRNEGRLHPGQFVRAEIMTASDTPALTVPTNAVVAFAGMEKAFVHASGKALEKRIITGVKAHDWVEVVAGLAKGDEVILHPGNLRTGTPVTRSGAR